MPEVRFFFDHGSGTVLWMGGASDQVAWGYAVDLDQLPVSESLRQELKRIVVWYDGSLNWDSPGDPGPWREPECRAFNQAVRETVVRLRGELGTGWQIVDGFREVHEDPDLDRYLADLQPPRR